MIFTTKLEVVHSINIPDLEPDKTASPLKYEMGEYFGMDLQLVITCKIKLVNYSASSAFLSWNGGWIGYLKAQKLKNRTCYTLYVVAQNEGKLEGKIAASSTYMCMYTEEFLR